MLIEYLNQQLLERASSGLQRWRRVAETPSEPKQSISAAHGGPAEAMLGFCSNDYLGLANHPSLIASLAEGARIFGAGSGASHLISGHSRAHAALEDDLAAWLSPHIPGARVLTFCTGYMANLALLTALADAHATIFSDKLNHASLIDGALLSRATLRRFAHGDLAVLAKQLAACRTPIKLIVTDAVFSMDGEVADLPSMLALAERHDAWLIVDDAHGFGVMGPCGQGTLAHFSLRSERMIYMGTLGKAAGLSGAFVAAHPTIIDWLLQTARTYVYSTASPPALAHALRQSLRLISGGEGAERRAQLTQRIAQLRSLLSRLIDGNPALNWGLGSSATAIQPLIVGDNAAAMSLAASLEANGLWVPAIRPPTVPAGTARLRITLRATHTAGDVARLAAGLEQAARKAV